MPNRDYIQTVAHELIKKYDTRDPFELCKAIGVEVFYADLGSLKGMYKYLKKNRFAVINEGLDSYSKTLVCAHAYSGAAEPQFRRFGNRLSGTGNRCYRALLT